MHNTVPPAVQSSLGKATRRMAITAAGFILLALVVVGVQLKIRSVTTQQTHRLFVTRTESGLQVRCGDDGPYIITHLVRYGTHESDKIVASLGQPLCIVDSSGLTIGTKEISALHWRSGITGDLVSAPNVGDELDIIYVDARRLREHNSVH